MNKSSKIAHKSLQIATSAIEIYNKPNFLYREEAFAILMINAWELLLKAQYLAKNDNKISSLYVLEDNNKNQSKVTKRGRKQKYKLNRCGQFYTHGLVFLIKYFKDNKILPSAAIDNIEDLMMIRDNAVHFTVTNALFAEKVLTLGAASLKNYSLYLSKWFHGINLHKYNLLLMPISFVDLDRTKDNITNTEINKFISYITKKENNYNNVQSECSYTIRISVEFSKSAKDINNINFIKSQQLNDDTIQVFLTEDDFKKQFPYKYDELISQCRDRYLDFKQNNSFHKIMRTIKADHKLSKTQQLDKDNPKSAKLTRYNGNIFKLLDKHFKKKIT